MKKIAEKKASVVGKIGSDGANSSLEELHNLGGPSGKPTLYHGDNLPDLGLSDKVVAVVPPGVNHQQSSGKKKFMRNDFMGSDYQEIVQKVKRDMSRRAIRDISVGGETFQNETEKQVGYRLLRESMERNGIKKWDSLRELASGQDQ